MKKVAVLSLLICLCACNQGKVDTSGLQEEMKAREIRVIPEAKITETAYALGDSLVAGLNVAEALAMPGKTFKTWDVKGVKIECTAYAFSQENALEGKEAQVFEAYQYNAENKLEGDPNIQKLPNEVLVYNAPIKTEGQAGGMWSIRMPRKYVVLSIRE